MSLSTERTLHSSEDQFYCTTCACHYSKAQENCTFCGNKTVVPLDSSKLKAYAIDLCTLPFTEVLKTHFNGSVPLLLLPIVLLIFIFQYLWGKVSKKGWLSPIFEGDIPFWKPLDEKESILKKSVKRQTEELENLGFSKVQTISLLSQYPETTVHIFEYRDKNCFASIFVSPVTNEYTHTGFSAVNRDNKYVVINNSAGTVSQCDSIIEKHFPNTSVSELFDLFNKHSGMRNQYSSFTAYSAAKMPHHREEIENALHTNSLVIMEEKEFSTINSTAIDMCEVHSMSYAVRRCTSCNANLCEQCVELVDNIVYCSRCKPAATEVSLSEAPAAAHTLTTALIPAGRSCRFMAVTTDTFIITAMVVLPAIIVSQTVSDPALMHILNSLFISLFLISYGVFSFKWKRSLGKRVWGVMIRDHDGVSEADSTSHFVRFAYKTASLLFIFPLLTYFSLFFNKKGIAIHDKLSTTSLFIKSKRNRIFARLLFVPVVFVFFSLFLIPFIITAVGIFNQEISENLVPQWEVKFNTGEYFFSSVTGPGDEEILTCETTDSLFVINSETGISLWSHEKRNETFLRDSCYMGNGVIYSKKSTSFTAFDIFTGEELWTLPLNSSDNYRDIRVVFNKDNILIYREGEATLVNRSGETLWNRVLLEKMSTLSHEPENAYYNYSGSYNNSDPIINEGILLFTTKNDTTDISYFSLEDGELLWSKSADPTSSIHSMADGVEIIMQEFKATALDLKTKRLLWKKPQEIYQIFDETSVNEQSILFANSGVFSGETGEKIWEYPEKSRFITLLDTLLFTSSNDGEIKATNIKTWESEAEWNIGDKSIDRYVTHSGNDVVFQLTSYETFFWSTSFLILNTETEDSKEILVGEGSYWLIDFQNNKATISTTKSLGSYSPML